MSCIKTMTHFFKILIILPIVFSALISSAQACTSFALYGREIFYAMNFDFDFIPLKFWIESVYRMKVFHMAFLYEPYIKDGTAKDYFANTCGMNSEGLFCACHEIEPYIEGYDIPGQNEIHIGDQYEALSKFSNIEDTHNFIKSKTAVQYKGPSLHNLFADKTKKALVAETNNSRNIITSMDSNFIIMSNFGNYTLHGKSYQEAVGVGAERYQLAHEYISENINRFNIEKGFTLLDKIYCRDKGCKTYCSMLFHPETNSVFIALKRNMDKIWKISLLEQTVETFSGYERYEKKQIGVQGIISNDLEALGA